MKIARQLSALQTPKHPICLAAGFFDGLHIGHQRVLGRAVTMARELGGQAWALTFDPHPMKVLRPALAPKMLTSSTHKTELLRRFGLDGCLLIPFTREFASIGADAFLRSLQRNVPALRAIFVGTDWRFGSRGTGNITTLTRWAQARGIVVAPTEPVLWRGTPVSSTRVRNAVSAGDLSLAARLLGRPFSVLGTVRHGARIGRRLGYPTANLIPRNEIMPPAGIYAARALAGHRVLDGVAYFGIRPTIARGAKPVLEFHAFDRNVRLYGRRIEVFFETRIRSERRFSDTAALVRQIRKDIENARSILAEPRRRKAWGLFLETWHPSAVSRR
jgi:riboflavin kinase/FMN adenylyltransferase